MEHPLDPAADVPGAGDDWVVVTSASIFLNEELGCGFGVLFCNRPMDEVALPRP
ncbi:hypothetical protein [Ornithinicoccus hortensis]|uniref:hypothetical protein n=1 Tax=Ornithinicoccus hortensis TaxID=82346 RepID=UPI001296FB12|nr:hypothetical protein [Ornithinicoccus hortensis]